MKSKKLSLNQLILVGIAGAVLILAISFLIIFTITYKPTIGFYNVSETVQNSILTNLTEASKSKRKFNTIVLDGSIPLSTQESTVKKCKILFVTKDCDTVEFSKNKIIKTLPQKLLQEMPNTIATSVPAKNKQISYVPILYDFYQIDVNYDFFKKTGIKNIDYWTDIEKALKLEKKTVKYPLVFDGKDNNTLLCVLGMLIEANSTPEEYNKILNRLYEAFKNDPLNYTGIIPEINSLNENSQAFRNAVAILRKLNSEKILSSDIYNLKKGDSTLYANNQLCGFYFTTLSDHRLIDNQVINNYKSIYTPSYKDNFKRMFPAPEIDVMCLKKGKKYINLIKNLAVYEQTGLSTFAGLAPANRECTPADIQASDVRYWLAASSGPLIPLGGAFPSEQAKYIAASHLQTLIK